MTKEHTKIVPELYPRQSRVAIVKTCLLAKAEVRSHRDKASYLCSNSAHQDTLATQGDISLSFSRRNLSLHLFTGTCPESPTWCHEMVIPYNAGQSSNNAG